MKREYRKSAMKPWRVGVAPLVVAATLLGAARSPAAAVLVQRGEYIAHAADCMSCHTAPGGKPYAGGDELKTVFGSIYGPNITPDARTGIGTWTKEDFTRALRAGIRKDGAPLYPAMPYIDYTKMSDADISALWAYLRSIPAVAHTVPAPEKTFKFPFNIREGVIAWQAIYLKPGLWQPTPGRSAAWNRGAYLVIALAHCGECHTPKNEAMAPEKKYMMTGGQLEGWYAPDISNDPLSQVAKYSVPELAHFLKTGSLPGNVTAFGPMRETIHDSLRYLNNSDLNAMAVYLKQQPMPRSESSPKATISAQEALDGKQLYEDNCSSCHQSNGQGLAKQVPALAGNTAVTAAEPNDVIMAMLQGFGPNGTWGAMGSFAKQLTDAQIADIANYVRTAWNNTAEPNARAWTVGDLRDFADVPARSRQPDLICPLLPANVSQPALNVNAAELKSAASDRAQLKRVVQGYLDSRPDSTPAQTVEALSSAYCRAVVSEKISMAQSSAKIASFTQEIAIVLSQTPAGRSK